MTQSCPRCRDVALQPMTAHGVATMVCSRCWGLWLDHAAVAAFALGDAAAAPSEALACPACRTTMRAWKVRDLVIDRCDVHGVWFDHTELDRVIERAHEPEPSKPPKTDVGGETTGFVVEAIAAIVDIFT